MKSFLIVAAFFFTSAISASAQTSWQKTSEEFICADPPFKQCHASTIVELAPGKLMAAWFGGSGEGQKDVTIWLSTKEKEKWTPPAIIANGIVNDTLRYPCWNPVLFKASNNKLFLFYKVGPSPQQWWGMVITSINNGKNWSAPVRLPKSVLGPIKNKPVQLANGTILSPSSTETKNNWKAHLELSNDMGNTWQVIPVDPLTGFDVIQPSILQYPNGRLQILCRSKQGAIIQSWSDDKGKTWGRLSKTTLLNPNSGIDAVTLQNGKQLLVYNPELPGKEWVNGRAKLNVAVSDDGVTWKDIAMLENGGKEEFSYPAVIQTKDGKVHITYTFDRKNIKHVVLEEKK